MLNSIARVVGAWFCNHEWSRRREPGRLYLECVHCLATTSGIRMDDERRMRADERAPSQHLVRAKA
jgi:hypothetical protein